MIACDRARARRCRGVGRGRVVARGAELAGGARTLREQSRLRRDLGQTRRKAAPLRTGDRRARRRDGLAGARGERVGRAEAAGARRELRLLRGGHERGGRAVRPSARRRAGREDSGIEDGRPRIGARQDGRRVLRCVARDRAGAGRRGGIARRRIEARSAELPCRASRLGQHLGLRLDLGEARRQAASLRTRDRRARRGDPFAAGLDERVGRAEAPRAPGAARREQRLLGRRDERRRKTVRAATCRRARGERRRVDERRARVWTCGTGSIGRGPRVHRRGSVDTARLSMNGARARRYVGERVGAWDAELVGGARPLREEADGRIAGDRADASTEANARRIPERRAGGR